VVVGVEGVVVVVVVGLWSVEAVPLKVEPPNTHLLALTLHALTCSPPLVQTRPLRDTCTCRRVLIAHQHGVVAVLYEVCSFL
jgi:hypothetical protein